MQKISFFNQSNSSLNNLGGVKLGFILFVIFLVIGSINIDDYGIGWDTEIQRRTGQIAYNYIFNDDQFYLTYGDRDYGIAFELPALIIEKAFGLKDNRSVYLMRHMANHIVFLFAALCCFMLIRRLYSNDFLAAAGFLFVVMCPRLYVHSFINPKDIPFFSMFMISLYLAISAVDKLKWKSLLLLGVSCGILTNIRVVGILLVGCILGYFVLKFLQQLTAKNKTHAISLVKKGFFFLFVFLLVLYISWPFLWLDPINNFKSAFLTLAKYDPDRWDTHLLFNGKLYLASKLVWYYPVLYFFGTNQIVPLIFGVLGLLGAIFRFVIKPFDIFTNKIKRANILFAVCYCAPLLATIILGSTLTDGWRHLFFLFAPFILLAVYGMHILWNSKLRPLAFVMIIVGLGFNINTMVANHPHQHTFFNAFISKNKPEHIRKSFEMDYYSISHRKAMEYILEFDKSEKISVYVVGRGPRFNRDIIPLPDRKRIEIAESIDYAKYYITSYRWHPGDFVEYKDNKFLDIKVDNNTITSVFRFY